VKYIYFTRKHFQYFLFFYTYTIVIFGMDKPQVFSLLTANKGFKIFDPDTMLKFRIPWKIGAPSSVVVTPDEKGVVIVKPGQVYHLEFSSFATPPRLLFEHRNVHHSPMITMAQKKDASLLIISAGNYDRPDMDQYVAEYIMFYINGPFEVHRIKQRIQAIKLSNDGKMLVIAADHNAKIINLEKDVTDVSFFDKDEYIVDVSINNDNTNIICSGSKGTIDLVNIRVCEERINSFVMKKVGTGDAIARLFYPSQEELLYLTSDSRIKVIGMYEFLENSPYSIDAKIIEGNNEKPIIGGNVETGIILTSSLSSLIAVDSYKEFTIVCLRDKKIKIYNRFGRLIAKIFIPILEKPHIYITESHVHKQKEGGFFCLNLCGKHIVALGTDGKMYLWVLPEEKDSHSAVVNEDVVLRKEKSNDVSSEKKKKFSKLRTSFTGKMPNDSKSSTDKRESGIQAEPKKSSSSRIKITSKSSSSGSTPAAKPEGNNPR
jgi:hypothetical protein